MNENLYKTLSKSRYGCYSSVNNNVCNPEECQCSEDWKTYVFKYEGFPRGGTFSLECRMEYGFAVEMSACMIIEIIGLYYKCVNTSHMYNDML